MTEKSWFELVSSSGGERLFASSVKEATVEADWGSSWRDDDAPISLEEFRYLSPDPEEQRGEHRIIWGDGTTGPWQEW